MPTLDQIASDASSGGVATAATEAYGSSAIAQQLSFGQYDESATGSYDLGLARIASLEGQLATSQDLVRQKVSEIVYIQGVNSQLYQQIRDLTIDKGMYKDLSDEQATALSAYGVRVTELETELATYEGSATDKRPGTIFDKVEDRVYDVIADRTTLLIGLLGGVAGAFVANTFRPGIKSTASGSVLGSLFGIIMAEFMETAWAEFMEGKKWYKPWTWF